MSKYHDLAKAIMDEIERCTLAREPILLSAIEAICERYVGIKSFVVEHSKGSEIPINQEFIEQYKRNVAERHANPHNINTLRFGRLDVVAAEPGELQSYKDAVDYALSNPQPCDADDWQA